MTDLALAPRPRRRPPPVRVLSPALVLRSLPPAPVLAVALLLGGAVLAQAGVPLPTGACCAGATCSLESEAACATLGGAYQGDGTECAPGLCALPPLNHFQCYDIERTKFDRVAVDLADDFGPSTVEVRRPRQLCAPVNKKGEDPTAPDDPDHLLGYEIRRTSARFERLVDELVTDQFGALALDLRRPDLLLVPTAKDVSGPAAPLDPPMVDHYQCYKVRGDRRRVPGIAVEDQFGTDVTAVKKPRRLCLPVDKNGEGILDNAARLMCYQTKPGPRVNKEVWFANQFGGGIVEARRARELCVPVEPDECPAGVRFEDRGLTVFDCDTGLEWEKKTAGNVNDLHTWSATGAAPDGTAFTTFLPAAAAALGGTACASPYDCTSSDGVTVSCTTPPPDGCWRLPEIDELQTILLAQFPCGTDPCIDPIFGPTASSFYWSATSRSFDPGSAWGVLFVNGDVNGGLKDFDFHVRAVRGGS